MVCMVLMINKSEYSVSSIRRFNDQPSLMQKACPCHDIFHSTFSTCSSKTGNYSYSKGDIKPYLACGAQYCCANTCSYVIKVSMFILMLIISNPSVFVSFIKPILNTASETSKLISFQEIRYQKIAPRYLMPVTPKTNLTADYVCFMYM